MSFVLSILHGRLGKRSKAAMYFTIASTGWRVLKRVMAEKPEVLYRTQLQPGDRIVVTARPRD